MLAVKRVEIVTDSLKMKDVTAALDRLGLSGYSLVRDVVGKGDRGLQAGDEATDVFSNSYLLTTCPPERLEAVVAAIRPILTSRGGICLVSDAHWVLH